MRHVMENVEQMLSVEKMLNPRLNRKKVWDDILSSRHSLFEKLCTCYHMASDEDEAAAGKSGNREKEAIKDAVIEKIQAMYGKISKEIHEPGVKKVPIQLNLLSTAEACMAIHFCEALPVYYEVLDVEDYVISEEDVDRITGKIGR